MQSLKIFPLLAILLSSIMLTSCGDKIKNFRDANEGEIQYFIPNGYKLVTDSQGRLGSNNSIVKINLDEDLYEEIILILDEGKNCENPNSAKLIAIDYQIESDKWIKIGDLNLNGNIAFPINNFNSDISDVNHDGVKEIPIFSETNGCGSGWTKFKQIITLKDNKIIDLTEGKLLVGDGSERMINSIQNGYEVFESVWNTDEGEAHFDCSRYHVRYFEWNNGKLEKKKEYTTKYKYYLEEDRKYNPKGENFTKNICVTTNNFDHLISYVRNDAVNKIYPSVVSNSESNKKNTFSIIQQDINLRESPSPNSKIIRPIIKGESVEIIGNLKIENKNWFNITSLNGESGWISDIGFIKDDNIKSAADYQ